MAFKPEEIKKFQDMANDMAKSIEDFANTSNEAAVAYSRIGRICARAVAVDAAANAKRTTRAENSARFQAARQARNNKRPGATPQPASARGGGQQQQQRA